MDLVRDLMNRFSCQFLFHRIQKAQVLSAAMFSAASPVSLSGLTGGSRRAGRFLLLLGNVSPTLPIVTVGAESLYLPAQRVLRAFWRCCVALHSFVSRGGRECVPLLLFISEVRFFHFRAAVSSFEAFLSFSEDDLLSLAPHVSLSEPEDGNGKSYYVKLSFSAPTELGSPRPCFPAPPREALRPPASRDYRSGYARLRDI